MYGDENWSVILVGALTDTVIHELGGAAYTWTLLGTETYDENDEAGTETTADDGTSWITDVGTLFGIADHETTTADGDEAIVMIAELGKFETHEIGTTCGLDQLVGTTTVTGTKTNDETATVTIAELGTEAITEFGTLFGTADHETIATDGDEARMITCDVESDETNDAGTATGDDHEAGMVTVFGTETDETVETTYVDHSETATEITAVLGTDWMTDFGTDPGTYDHEIIAADGEPATERTTDDGSCETYVHGTTTGEAHDDGTTTEAGTKTNDDAATETTFELGTVVITEFGTLLGTADHWTIATDGELAGTTTYDDESDETHESGRATGLDHVDGKETTLGTLTLTLTKLDGGLGTAVT
jgi:hypothetical protein